MDKNQRGSHLILILIVIAVIGVISALIWVFFSNTKHEDQSDDFKSTQSDNVSAFIWQQTQDGWTAKGTPPACADQPMLKMPADLSEITSVLYPGQTRGGNYKPHGGLRFDSMNDNTITVTAPMDGYLIKGTRFIAQPENEIQYGFTIMNNCGVMYVVGHLRELPSRLQAIVETFPEANESSVSQDISPAVFIKQGDVLATKVGILGTKNTFFDFGVFDHRTLNDASKSSDYQSAHAQAKDTAWHAVCWLKDWLPDDDVSTIAGLPPGDPGSGKSSDYC